MFINLNYFLSILLHIIILFILFFMFNNERQIKKYNEVINISLKTLKNTKTEKIFIEKKSVDPKKQTVSKNQSDDSPKNIKEIKKLKSKNKKNITKNNNINNFQENKEKETKITNNNPSKKKRESIEQPKVISQQQSLKKEETSITSAEVTSNEDIKAFNKYNAELKALIQEKATRNYPRISLRKKEEGVVELNFSIDINGNITNITIGKKTSSPKRLINASINTLELISPYKKNPILKKNNTFSIIIVYKLK